MYKVRFHLAKGKNHRTWQIKNSTGGITSYVDPLTHSLYISGRITLVNNPTISRKVFNSQRRDVCGYILGEYVTVTDRISDYSKDIELCFDPKKTPHWTTFDGQVSRIIYDSKCYLGDKRQIISRDRRLYLCKEF